MKIEKGDYVLATKYQDGDPGDHFAVGFFGYTIGKEPFLRYIVIDNEGNPFRANGFRRIKKISHDRGVWLIKHFKEIEMSSHSVWWWVRQRMNKESMP